MLQANQEQLQASRQAEREAEQKRREIEKQRQQTERDAKEKRKELERKVEEKGWQAKQQNKKSKRRNEKAEKEAELERMLALQREYLEEKARRLLAEQQLAVQEQKLKHGNTESSVVSLTESTQVETVTATPGTIAGDTLIYASHSYADPEHVTTDVLHQSQLSPQTSISTIQVTAASQTPSPTMVTETVNTPCVSVTNLSVDTVQVQNNDAEQSISIADNALNVTNVNNG